jgi:hypothetical protein
MVVSRMSTVRKRRGQFQVSWLERLSNESRPGAPRKITDEQVEMVITKTLQEGGPGDDPHWIHPLNGRSEGDVAVGDLTDLASLWL